jgi:hypothetical protein
MDTLSKNNSRKFPHSWEGEVQSVIGDFKNTTQERLEKKHPQTYYN